jgi:flagellar hook assembly protein FlgD
MVESPQNIKFVTPEIGYICSYQGIGAMTTDGGESWSVLERAVDDLIFAMEVQDLNHITLVGEKGCIVSASIGGVAGVEPTGDQDPRVLHLLQNYPNPFNPETQIDYFQPAQGYVRLEVYDILGREIATLIDGLQPAGNHSVKWDASSVSGGIYFYRLQTAGHIEARKMILLK